MVKKVTKKVVVAKPKKVVATDYSARMNRILGQVGGVKKMFESKKSRAEIIVQLKAVRSAIKALEAEVLEEHLQASAADLATGSAAQKTKKITDLKKIFLRFE